jgi:hypothetical protein
MIESETFDSNELKRIELGLLAIAAEDRVDIEDIIDFWSMSNVYPQEDSSSLIEDLEDFDDTDDSGDDSDDDFDIDFDLDDPYNTDLSETKSVPWYVLKGSYREDIRIHELIDSSSLRDQGLFHLWD